MGAKFFEILIQFVVVFVPLLWVSQFLGEVGVFAVLGIMIAAHQYHIGNLINRVKELENASHS